MAIKVSVPNRFQLKTTPNFRTVLMPRQGEVHYIEGADALPVPLGSREGSRIIGLLEGEGDKGAGAALTEHNLRLVIYIVKKFNDISVGVEDLISVGTTGLVKVINTLRPDRNIKLTIYASRCAENKILMYLGWNNKTHLGVPIDEPLNVGWDGNKPLLSGIFGTDKDVIYHNIEDRIEKSLLGNAINRLGPRECKIVELRCGLTNEDGEEMTQKEVADLLGTSQSYVSRLEEKIMKRLKKEIVRFE